jgi:tryptophan synthase beta chain
VGPEHSYLKDTGRATYAPVDDAQALEGFHLLSRSEGISPALESAHAVYYASELARQLGREEIVLVCLSGRGDKDVPTVARSAGIEL